MIAYGFQLRSTFSIIVIWGLSVAPDSAQFSALDADAAPAKHVGSLLTLQTTPGFALTVVTVQVTPVVASMLGWPTVLAGLALGPIVGVAAMFRRCR